MEDRDVVLAGLWTWITEQTFKISEQGHNSLNVTILLLKKQLLPCLWASWKQNAWLWPPSYHATSAAHRDSGLTHQAIKLVVDSSTPSPSGTIICQAQENLKSTSNLYSQLYCCYITLFFNPQLFSVIWLPKKKKLSVFCTKSAAWYGGTTQK